MRQRNPRAKGNPPGRPPGSTKVDSFVKFCVGLHPIVAVRVGKIAEMRDIAVSEVIRLAINAGLDLVFPNKTPRLNKTP